MLTYVTCTDHNDFFLQAGRHAARRINRVSSSRMDGVCVAITLGHDALAASSLPLKISTARECRHRFTSGLFITRSTFLISRTLLCREEYFGAERSTLLLRGMRCKPTSTLLEVFSRHMLRPPDDDKSCVMARKQHGRQLRSF